MTEVCPQPPKTEASNKGEKEEGERGGGRERGGKKGGGGDKGRGGEKRDERGDKR